MKAKGMPAAALASGIVMTGAMLGFPGEDYTTPQTIKGPAASATRRLRPERIERLKWAIATNARTRAERSLAACGIPAGTGRSGPVRDARDPGRGRRHSPPGRASRWPLRPARKPPTCCAALSMS